MQSLIGIFYTNLKLVPSEFMTTTYTGITGAIYKLAQSEKIPKSRL